MNGHHILRREVSAAVVLTVNQAQAVIWTLVADLENQ